MNTAFGKLTAAEAILLQLYATESRGLEQIHYILLGDGLNRVASRRIKPAAIRARASELQRQNLLSIDNGRYQLSPKGIEFVESDIAPKLTDEELGRFGGP